MDVIISQPAEIAIQTLTVDDQRRVMAWCDHLANWENDPFIRDHSHRLSEDDSIFVLRTSSDLRMFFTFDENRIVVLDIARTAALQAFSTSTE